MGNENVSDKYISNKKVKPRSPLIIEYFIAAIFKKNIFFNIKFVF